MNVSHLTGEAWAAWNASYYGTHADAYRVVGATLYRHALSEKIQALYARLDEQNARLDALTASREPSTR
ncbi:MAG: hypothetical protein NVS2B16_17510 [Chloroflexota bacterium]